MRPTLLFPALGVLLAVLGWPLAAGRVRRNRWYGLRVPATLADEHVWYEANAIAGRDMVALGVGVAVFGVLLPLLVDLPPDLYAGICAGLLGIGSLALSVRGWVTANRLLRQRGVGSADRPRNSEA